MNQPGAFAQNLNLDCPCCFRPGTVPSNNYNNNDITSMTSLTPSQKISALQILLAENDLDAYLILSSDAHNSEYLSPCDDRRSYLTGFTGSAGVALVTARGEALLWTDSRYFIQAAEQLKDGSNKSDKWVLMKQFEAGVLEVDDWIAEHLGGKRVGVDPTTIPYSRA